MADPSQALAQSLLRASQSGNYLPFFSAVKSYQPAPVRPLAPPPWVPQPRPAAAGFTPPPVRSSYTYKPGSAVAVIVQNARRFGLDPAAIIAYALEESGGRWGAVGDQGTSFGPFQAHIGGAAGSRTPQQASRWANSPQGLIQMMGMMARTPIRGKTGEAAVRAIYQYFGKGTPAAVPRGLARLREAELIASGHAAAEQAPGQPVRTGTWRYPQMAPGGQSPFAGLSFAGHTDFVHVDTGLLAKLNELARVLGVRIEVISGYRSPGYSSRVGGYANDPHARGVAVDAYINGVPIGDYKGAFKVLRQLGLESGATPGFYRGKRDPEHVQIPGSGINKRIHARRTLSG